MPVPTPVPITQAFAQSGAKNTIPNTSQIAITPGAASFVDGFPPLTFKPLLAGGIAAGGGVAPSGADMNGILNMLSAYCAALQAGQYPAYDAGVSAAIGGYALGAILTKADGSGQWISTAAANVTDPETGGAGWVTVGAVRVAAVADLTAMAAGSRAFVTDATAPAFGQPVVGGGTVATPVYSDGLQWLVG